MKQKVVQKTPEQEKKPAPNLTGIPTQMKLDFERRSGLSFDDVRVHYNSDKPRKIGALAYTRIPQVHIGPGQERHLKHELGHVVQQKRGVVKPTTTINNIPINDDPSLERLASSTWIQNVVSIPSDIGPPVVQCIPSVVNVAETRFLAIYHNLFVAPNAPNAPNLNMAQTFQHIIRQAQRQAPGHAQNQVRAILIMLLQTGLPNHLAQMMSNQLANGNIAQAHLAFALHYNNFNTQRGVDRNQIDPRQNSQRRVNLIHLKHVLRRNVLPLVQRAIQQGNIAPFQNRGIQQLHQISTLIQLNRFSPQLSQSIRRGATITNALINPSRRNRRYMIPIIPSNILLNNAMVGGVTALEIQTGRGTQWYGLGAGPSQAVHENFHLVENNLLVNDFANLHRFLQMRTNPLGNGERRAGWGNAPTGGVGYDAELPPMEFQNVISRALHSNHSMLRFALFNLGNGILSLFTPNPERGQQFIDDFFLQESNSESTSYATLYHDAGGAYATEFLSTTGELFSTVRGATALIEADPTRAAMFIYLTNRPLFNALDRAFQGGQLGPNIQTLPAFLHIL